MFVELCELLMYYSIIHPFFTHKMTWNKTTRTQHNSPRRNWLIGIVLGEQSVHHAGKMVGISSSSADHIWKEHTATGSTRILPHSGHPRSVTDKAKCCSVRTAVKEPWFPFQEIANLIDPHIIDVTIQNVLAGQWYHWRVSHKVSYLCITHKWEHMQWAQKYKSYNTNNWGKIIWSDECNIYLGDNWGRIYVTQHPDEEFGMEGATGCTGVSRREGRVVEWKLPGTENLYWIWPTSPHSDISLKGKYDKDELVTLMYSCLVSMSNLGFNSSSSIFLCTNNYLTWFTS